MLKEISIPLRPSYPLTAATEREAQSIEKAIAAFNSGLGKTLRGEEELLAVAESDWMTEHDDRTVKIKNEKRGLHVSELKLKEQVLIYYGKAKADKSVAYDNAIAHHKKAETAVQKQLRAIGFNEQDIETSSSEYPLGSTLVNRHPLVVEARRTREDIAVMDIQPWISAIERDIDACRAAIAQYKQRATAALAT